jgi:hypothetical protein
LIIFVQHNMKREIMCVVGNKMSIKSRQGFRNYILFWFWCATQSSHPKSSPCSMETKLTIYFQLISSPPQAFLWLSLKPNSITCRMLEQIKAMTFDMYHRVLIIFFSTILFASFSSSFFYLSYNREHAESMIFSWHLSM